MRLNVFSTNSLLVWLFSLGMLLSTLPLQAADPAAGEKLFRTNCATCHRVDRNLTGPALAGVSAKYAGDMEWLYSWVKNSQSLIKSGDAKAVALYEQYNKVQMQAFPTLSNDDIDNIFAWVDEEAARIEAEKNATQVVSGGPDGGDPLSDPSIYYALLGLVAVLVLISLLLVVITATLITAVRAKDNEEPFTVSEVWQRTRSFLANKFVLTTIIIVVLVGGMTRFVEFARGVGIQQGYMPEQPIKFSHKTHAGTYEIQCEYCHSGVTKSKNAWIPSVNVCMNCHKAIQEGPEYGKEEISKIYQAIGFDPATSQYIEGYEQKAVEWVRIHNLPDHAYFNHAQHVVVGGLACQTCHGEVQEMDVVYQYSTLGMGWCIDCHRQTKVKDLGKENSEGLTVEDMGGLDCARCHY